VRNLRLWLGVEISAWPKPQRSTGPSKSMLALFPGLHAQLLSLAVQKSGGKAWMDLSRDACRG